jgi:hypothetical protein
MSDAAFWVEGFSTGYRIGPRERYEALRDIITDAFVAPFRRLRENPQSAIRNSECLSGCLLPCRPLTFHVSRFSALGPLTFHGLIPHSEFEGTSNLEP